MSFYINKMEITVEPELILPHPSGKGDLHLQGKYVAKSIKTTPTSHQWDLFKYDSDGNEIETKEATVAIVIEDNIAYIS